MPGIEWVATLNDEQFIESQNRIRASVQQINKQVEQSGMTIDKYIDDVRRGMAAIAAGFSVKTFINQMVKVRGEFQQLEVAFTTMLGSAEKADALMQQLTKTAAVTPFDLQGVAAGAKSLMAYGTAAENVNEMLVRLGDIAAGMSIPLNDLVYLYGTTMNQGRMFTQDLRQFQGRGIPIAEELAKVMNVTKETIPQLVTAGKVTADVFHKAIVSMTEEGSRFGGLMEAQSKTITGQISNIEDAVDMMFNNIGKKSEGVINKALSGVAMLVEHYETIGKIIISVATAYGTYKGALLAVVAVQRAMNVAGSVSAFLSLAKSVTTAKDAMALFNLVTKTNPIGLVVSAVATAATAFALFGNKASGAEKIENQFNEATTKATANVKALYATLNTANKTSKVASDTARELKQIADEYGVTLSEEAKKTGNESKLVEELTKKREELIDAIRREAIERERVGQQKEIEDSYVTKIQEARDKFVNSLSDDFSPQAKGIMSQLITDDELERLGRAEAEVRRLRETHGEYSVEVADAERERAAMTDELVRKLWDYSAQLGRVEGDETKYAEAASSMKDALIDFIRTTNDSTVAQENAKIALAQSTLATIEQIRVQDAAKVSVETLSSVTSSLITLWNSENHMTLKIHYDDSEIPKWMKGLTDEQLAKSLAARQNAIRGNKNVRYGNRTFGSNEQTVTEMAMLQSEMERRKPKTATPTPTITPAAAKTSKSSADKAAREAEKQAEDAAKRRDRNFELEQKKLEQQLQQEQATRAAVEKERIAGIKNEGERKREEEAEQHRLNLEAIDNRIREMKEKILEEKKAEWETQNKSKTTVWADTEQAKKGISNITLTDDQRKQIEAEIKTENIRYAKLLEDRIKEERESMYSYLQEYGTFQEQKLAIAEEYAKKIADAEASGNKWEAKSLTAQRDSKIAQANARSIAMDIDWNQTFQGIGNILQDLAKETLQKVNEYMATAEFKGLDSAAKKAYTDLKQQLIDAGGQTASNPFSSKTWKEIADLSELYKSQVQSLAEASGTHADATKEYEEAMKREESARADLEKALREQAAHQGEGQEVYALAVADSRAVLEKATQDVSEAFEKVTETGEAVQVQQQDVANTQANLHRKTEAAGEGLSNFNTVVGQITSGSLVGFADGVANIINAIIGGKHQMEGLSGLFGDAGKEISGLVGAILSIMDMLGNKPVEFIDDLFDKISEVFEAVIAHIPEIIASVVKGVGGIVGGIFGGIGELFNIGGSNAKEVRETIDKLSDRNEILTKSIDRLNDTMSGKGGNSAIRQYEKMAELQKELEENIKKQMEAQMSFHGKHHSFNYYWDGFDDNLLANFNRRNGTSWNGDLHTLTADLAALLEADADMMEAIRDAGKGGYGEDVSEWITQLAEQAGKAKEQLDALYSSLTAGTTSENVFDDFLSSLYDLADGSEEVMDNVAENWQKMVNRMVVNNLVGEKLRGDLEGWYVRLAELNKEYADGDTNYEEYRRQLEALEKEYQGYLSQAEKDIDTFKELGIIKTLEDVQEEAKTYFDGLRESWLSTLTDMEADSKSWKNTLVDQVFSDLVDATVLNVPITVNTTEGEKSFDDFNAYLENWKERYKAVIEGAYENEADRIAAINALIEEQTKVRDNLTEHSKELAAGLGKDLTEAFSNSLDTLGDTLLSALLDTEQDAGQMGKEIAQTLIKEMMAEMLSSEKYKDRFEEIRKMWQDILKGNDTEHTIDDVLKAITALNEEIANDDGLTKLAEKFKELGKTAEASPFNNLRQQFLDTLMDMEGDAETFRKNLNNTMLKDLMERQVFNVPFTINGMSFDDFDKYLEDWNERYTAAVESGNQAAIDALLDELVKAREITIEAAQEFRDRLAQNNAVNDTTFKDMADSWASALMDMGSTAEDWADEIGRTMAEKIIEQMVVPTMIQPLLDNLQNVFNGVMGKAVTTDGEGNKLYDWSVILGSTELTDEVAKISAEYPQIQELIKKIMEAFGLDTSKAGGFSDLGGSILDSLSRTDDDITKWAEDMGKAMARSMAQAYIDTNYQGKIDELNKQWQEALDAGDAERIAEIEAALKSLYSAMENDQALQGLVDKFKEMPENPFSNMRSTFLSSLLDMEADAEQFAKEMTRILTEQMIDKVLESGFQDRINGLGEEWSAALASGDRAAIERIKNEMVALRNEMGEAVQPLLDTIESLEDKTDTTFKGMAGSWVSALMDMETTAEQWAQNVGRTMAQRIIEELIVGKMMQPLLDEIQAAMDTALAVPGATWQSAVDAMTPYLGNLKDSFGELQPIVEQILNAFGIFREVEEEVVEEVKEGFSDLRGTIASSLMDMEADAEKFAKDIARTMTGQMVESLIEKQFGSQIAALNEQWYNALENGDSAALERIKQQVIDLQKQCGQAVQPLLDALKEIEKESDETFTSMRDDFLSALMDMYAGTQGFVTDLKYLLTQKMVEKFVLNEQFDAWLKEFQSKYDTISSGTDLEKMAEEMDRLSVEWARKAEELQEQTNHIFDVTGWTTELMKMSSPLADLRDNFRSALLDMQSDAEGFAQDISRALTEAFVDKFVLGDEFEKKLAEWQEQYAAIMRGNYSEEDRAILLKHLQAAITAAKDGYAEEAKAIQDLMGSTNGTDQGASMSMSDKATYDQFETYLGIATAQQMATLQGNEVRNQILAMLQSMSGISNPNGNTVREIRMMMNTTNEYLLDIRRSNRQILEQFGLRLDSINDRLARFL